MLHNNTSEILKRMMKICLALLISYCSNIKSKLKILPNVYRSTLK